MSITPTAPTTRRSTPAPPRRFVHPDNLFCCGCGEQVRCAPPAYWLVRDGLPAPQFSHQDGTALCRHADGHVTKPVEVRP